jgi:hypothetical protein
LVLCALALSAFAAPSAFAVTTGYTAFTCKNVGTGNGTRSDAHCLTETPGGAWTHKSFTKATDLTATNEGTAAGTTAKAPSILEGKAAGVITAIECSTVMGNGTMSNKAAGEEMYIHGEGTLNYSGCIVTKPVGKSCVVKEGKVNTNPLTATTEKQGMDLKFQPKEGETFAEITIEKCTVAGLNNTFPVTGSLKVEEIETQGATASTTHEKITKQETLKFAGQNAGLSGSLTFKGKETTQLDSETTGLVATTPVGGVYTE